MEKNRLVRFVAKVMEESGFKVYQNFKTSRHMIDIYGVLPTVLGDMGVVVACKNYDERWEVGLDVLKEMEMVAKTLKASKVVVITTSYFTKSAINYAGRRNIKIVDKDGLLTMAKKFSGNAASMNEPRADVIDNEFEDEEDYVPASNPISRPKSRVVTSGLINRGKQSLSKKTGQKSVSSVGPMIKAILRNIIALIIIVFLLSSFAAYLISFGYKNTAVLGVSKILFSAILAYGIVILVERDATKILTKGTTVFFVTMIMHVIIIILT
ncbi:MAG: restriction endonuclease [Methanobacterium aggregans]